MIAQPYHSSVPGPENPSVGFARGPDFCGSLCFHLGPSGLGLLPLGRHQLQPENPSAVFLRTFPGNLLCPPVKIRLPPLFPFFRSRSCFWAQGQRSRTPRDNGGALFAPGSLAGIPYGSLATSLLWRHSHLMLNHPYCGWLRKPLRTTLESRLKPLLVGIYRGIIILWLLR